MDLAVFSEIYIYCKYLNPGQSLSVSWVNVKKWVNHLGFWGVGLERGAAGGQNQLRRDFQGSHTRVCEYRGFNQSGSFRSFVYICFSYLSLTNYSFHIILPICFVNI